MAGMTEGAMEQQPLPEAGGHDSWDIDHEEKARNIAEDDLNRKKKQVCVEPFALPLASLPVLRCQGH
jgi:hypothetical protein